MLRKDFSAVRIARSSARVLETAVGAGVAGPAATNGPRIVVMNHCSWWDPLVGLFLHQQFMPGRAALAPMDAAQLRRFNFFRKVGVFGIAPANPHALEQMIAYVEGEFSHRPNTTLYLTPQGEFADVRSPLRLRPGAAALAARLGVRSVVSVSAEYVFWNDRRPEILLRAAPVPRPPGASSTTGWMRAIAGAMQDNAAALAELAIARNPAAFQTLLGKGPAARIHPFYDLWLRARGQSGRVGPIGSVGSVAPPADGVPRRAARAPSRVERDT